MAELLTVTSEGIYCPPGDFHVDPWRPVARAVVTHAHADHARGGAHRILASATGAPLLRQRLGPGSRVEAVGWGESLRFGGVRVSLNPAGHIRGSAQVRVEHRGEVWVVSGDYKLQPDPTAEPFDSSRPPEGSSSMSWSATTQATSSWSNHGPRSWRRCSSWGA